MSAIELASPLAPEECEARLRAATDRGGLLQMFGSRPVVGRVSGGSVLLRKRIGYRNSFQTILTGSFEGRGGATVFRGTADIHPLVTVFMAVWFGGLVLMGGVVLVANLPAMLVGGGPPMGVVVLPLMGVFGIGVVWFGRWLARGEEAYLVAFVTKIIAAGRAPDAEPGATADGGA